MIISFSGHRDIGGEINVRNSTYIKVEEEVEKLLSKLKPEKILSGMALGLDTLACDIAIKLNIKYDSIVPFRGQEKSWPKETQKKYFNYLEKADKTVIVCEGDYASWKFQKRNEYLVDNCDEMIFYLKDMVKSSGTLNCYKYAVTKNKTIYKIDDDIS